MKNLLFLIFLGFILGCAFVQIKAQSNLQKQINSLQPGKSTFKEIESIFGKPDTRAFLSKWINGSSVSNDVKRNYYFVGSKVTDSYKDQPVVNLYEVKYKKQGLILSFFDNPDELYSIEIENPKILVLGLKVGDPLSKVIKLLGKNDEWTSTDGSDYWTLSYDELNISFEFLRDKKLPQYPMKLNKNKIIKKIEKYNNNISFGG